jgi:hypothetical protein
LITVDRCISNSWPKPTLSTTMVTRSAT